MNRYSTRDLQEDGGRDQTEQPADRADTETQVHVTDSRRHAGPGKEASPSLPHERDTQSSDQQRAPDPKMERARRDIESGQVDTDLRNTPGLDAPERARQVPGDRGGSSR